VILLLLGVVIFFVWRGGSLKLSHAVLCVLYGLFLAQTGSIGPWITRAVSQLAGLLANIQL